MVSPRARCPDCYDRRSKPPCLRNDLAFDVLWYNTGLMKQFGYSVPDHVGAMAGAGREGGAVHHPGYIVGTLGNSDDDTIYLQAAQCPVPSQLTAPTLVVNPRRRSAPGWQTCSTLC